jgi:hypothetical protein
MRQVNFETSFVRLLRAHSSPLISIASHPVRQKGNPRPGTSLCVPTHDVIADTLKMKIFFFF